MVSKFFFSIFQRNCTTRYKTSKIPDDNEALIYVRITACSIFTSVSTMRGPGIIRVVAFVLVKFFRISLLLCQNALNVSGPEGVRIFKNWNVSESERVRIFKILKVSEFKICWMILEFYYIYKPL